MHFTFDGILNRHNHFKEISIELGVEGKQVKVKANVANMLTKSLPLCLNALYLYFLKIPCIL